MGRNLGIISFAIIVTENSPESSMVILEKATEEKDQSAFGTRSATPFQIWMILIMIFNLSRYKGLSCFEIMHKLEEEDSFLDIADGKNTTVKRSHPIFKHLEDAYKEKYGDPVYTKEQWKQLQKNKEAAP